MPNMMMDVAAQQGNFFTSPTIDTNDYAFKKNCKLGKSLQHRSMCINVLS